MISNGRNHQATPPNVREYARQQWGPFDADMAASAWNALAPVYWSESDPFQHAVIKSPQGTLWANPPWQAKPGIGVFVDAWVENIEHFSRTVWLLPSRTGQEWFTTLSQLCATILIRGRLRFDPPPGEPKGGGGFEDCVFFVHGDPLGEPGKIYPGPRASKGDIIL